MGRRDEFDFDDRPSVKGSIFVAVMVVITTIIAVAAIVLFITGGIGNKKITPEVLVGESVAPSDSVQDNEALTEDDRSGQEEITGEQENETEISQILPGNGAVETEEQTDGIDVSRYQGNIDWQQVAQSGIDFAMIRVGYRTKDTGEIVEDSTAKYNLQEATANGIKVGAYFFSTAVSEEEAMEEAQWTADFIARYKITYPVAYNCEGYDDPKSRQYHLTKEERTNIAKAFLNEIYDLGYAPMFYASRAELGGDLCWITSDLEKSYKIWVSWYPARAYPETPVSDYAGRHDMWQHTNRGEVPGIDYAVDVNVAYFGYEREAEPKDDTPPEKVGINVEAGHNFTEVNEVVTAKDATNLRNVPSQGEDSQVMVTLKNGQTATRTGISDSGWSRVLYSGETYYAVSSLLTTDLSAKAPDPTPEPDDGIKTVFTAREDMVSPKMEVNLRTLPSVTHPESVVVVTLPYGSVVKRTGINEDVGWSRVEYEGKILYCVSSYVYVVE